MKQISGIYIYPVKSLGAISLQETVAKTTGLTYDRQWMVVDMTGMFLSQRKVPKMALIQPGLSDGQLILRAKGQEGESISTPLQGPESTSFVKVQVWNDEVQARVCAEEVNEWLSDQLGTFCRLVYLPGQQARPLSQKYGKTGEATLFSDSCPLLITGEAALQDLNSHLADPIPMSRFRPNLVFSGGIAYEEDKWEDFQIGTAQYRGIRRCTRCKMINIDQMTAQVYREPLQALAQYRRDQNGIYFGLHASVALDAGNPVIRLGDQIAVR